MTEVRKSQVEVWVKGEPTRNNTMEIIGGSKGAFFGYVGSQCRKVIGSVRMLVDSMREMEES